MGSALSEWKLCWRTVLGHEGVVRGVEGEEPVPVRMETEQHGGGAESAGETGGSHRRSRSRRANDSDIPKCSHGGGGSGDSGGEAQALVVRRVGGEVEDVAIARVVHRQKEPEEAAPVSTAASEEVSEAGRRIGPAPDGGSGGSGRDEAREAEARRGEEEEDEGEEEGDGSQRQEERPPPPLAGDPAPGASSRAHHPHAYGHGLRRRGSGEGRLLLSSDYIRAGRRRRGSNRVAGGEVSCGVGKEGSGAVSSGFVRVRGLLGQRETDRWVRNLALSAAHLIWPKPNHKRTDPSRARWALMLHSLEDNKMSPVSAEKSTVFFLKQNKKIF